MGNTAMVFSDLDVCDTELTEDTIAQLFDDTGIDDDTVRPELLDLFTVQPKSPMNWTAAPDWELAYTSPLTQPGDFDGWQQQGCLQQPFLLQNLAITTDGLTIHTPDVIDTESRAMSAVTSAPTSSQRPVIQAARHGHHQPALTQALASPPVPPRRAAGCAQGSTESGCLMSPTTHLPTAAPYSEAVGSACA